MISTILNHIIQFKSVSCLFCRAVYMYMQHTCALVCKHAWCNAIESIWLEKYNCTISAIGWFLNNGFILMWSVSALQTLQHGSTKMSIDPLCNLLWWGISWSWLGLAWLHSVKYGHTIFMILYYLAAFDLKVFAFNPIKN